MQKEFPIWKDITISLGITISVILISYFTGIKYAFNTNDFSIIISLLGVVLGVLFTVLTILYAFEDNLKQNIAFKELKAKGKYELIYPIFIDSITVIFYSLIILIVAFFLREIAPSGFLFNIYFAIVIIVIVASFIRTYRCIFVYALLQKVISKYK